MPIFQTPQYVPPHLKQLQEQEILKKKRKYAPPEASVVTGSNKQFEPLNPNVQNFKSNPNTRSFADNPNVHTLTNNQNQKVNSGQIINARSPSLDTKQYLRNPSMGNLLTPPPLTPPPVFSPPPPPTTPLPSGVNLTPPLPLDLPYINWGALGADKITNPNPELPHILPGAPPVGTAAPKLPTLETEGLQPELTEVRDTGGSYADKMEQMLKRMTSGRAGYTDEWLRGQLGVSEQEARTRASARQRMMEDELSKRGMLKSGQYARGTMGIGRELEADIAKQHANIRGQFETKRIDDQLKRLQTAAGMYGNMWTQEERDKYNNAMVGLQQQKADIEKGVFEADYGPGGYRDRAMTTQEGTLEHERTKSGRAEAWSQYTSLVDTMEHGTDMEKAIALDMLTEIANGGGVGSGWARKAVSRYRKAVDGVSSDTSKDGNVGGDDDYAAGLANNKQNDKDTWNKKWRGYYKSMGMSDKKIDELAEKYANEMAKEREDAAAKGGG